MTWKTMVFNFLHLKTCFTQGKAAKMHLQCCNNIAPPAKHWIVQFVESFKTLNPPIFHLPSCLAACLPAVKPTSTRRIGPVFSHNESATTELLFRWRFIYYAIVFTFTFLSSWKGENSKNVLIGFLLCHKNFWTHL